MWKKIWRSDALRMMIYGMLATSVVTGIFWLVGFLR